MLNTVDEITPKLTGFDLINKDSESRIFRQPLSRTISVLHSSKMSISTIFFDLYHFSESSDVQLTYTLYVFIQSEQIDLEVKAQFA